MPVSKIPGAGISGGSVTVNQSAPDNSWVIDSSGNVGIGTTTPTDSASFTRALDLNGTLGAAYYARTNGSSTNYTAFGNFGADGYINNRGAGTIQFYTNGNIERMRISSNGDLLVGTTSTNNAKQVISFNNNGFFGTRYVHQSTTYNNSAIEFLTNTNGSMGYIYCNGSSTSYVTSSDYRLKENVAPMTGALAKIAQLKPCTYTWKATGETGQGFIAHELAEVCPDAVAGEKDAVETYTDEEGNEQTRIKPQGIDTSFLVATLTAAIQELKAELDATKAEVQALKGAN